jgi:outer membrane protein assembly factor BamB
VTGVLSCLNAADGKVVWRKDDYAKAWPRFFTGTSPMIVDGMVVAQVGSESAGAIVALDLATGNEKWKWAGEGPMYASPALMTADGVKQVVTLTAKSAVGVAVADGKLLWQVASAPAGMNYNAATPIIDGQTVYITGAGRGTKALKIEKKGDAFAAAELWSAPEAVQFNSPVLKDGLLFGFTDKGLLFCINAKDGKNAWTDATNRGRGFAAIVDAGPVLFALPMNSELLVYKPSDKGYEEVAKYKVADTATYAHPLIAGNRIFVKDKDSLTLWTIK